MYDSLSPGVDARQQFKQNKDSKGVLYKFSNIGSDRKKVTLCEQAYIISPESSFKNRKNGTTHTSVGSEENFLRFFKV